jgi:hypothetical protein
MTAADIQSAALAFSVSTRAIYRWLKRGVNISDPLAVALYVVTSHENPRTETLTAVSAILEKELQALS